MSERQTAADQEARLERTVPLLVVANIEQSQSFYCEGLGFEVTEGWSPGGKLAWCWLQRDGAAIMLQQACEDDADVARGQGVTFYFLCNDADAVHQELSQRGIDATPPTVAFYGMNQSFVVDPDGYQLCFENRIEK